VRRRGDLHLERVRRASSAALLALVLALPGAAAAEGQLLIGVSAGAAAIDLSGPGTLRFALGAGADLIDHRGWALGLRVALLHDLAVSSTLRLGWLGQGLVRGRGLPLGVMLGPSAAGAPGRAATAGGGAALVWGLWYARATLELAGHWRVPLAAVPERDDVGVALMLHVVPWVVQ
jgi:hypothetical protein